MRSDLGSRAHESRASLPRAPIAIGLGAGVDEVLGLRRVRLGPGWPRDVRHALRHSEPRGCMLVYSTLGAHRMDAHARSEPHRRPDFELVSGDSEAVPPPHQRCTQTYTTSAAACTGMLFVCKERASPDSDSDSLIGCAEMYIPQQLINLCIYSSQCAVLDEVSRRVRGIEQV